MSTDQNLTETAQALGIARGTKLWLRDVPDALRQAIDADNADIELLAAPSAGIDIAVIVIADVGRLNTELRALADLIQPAGHVWLLWDGDVVPGDQAADTALDTGFTPSETRRIDGRWNGLKLTPAP